MWVIVLLLIYFIGRGGYVAAESRWGVGAGVVSCLIAYALPILTFCFYIMSQDDDATKKAQGKHKEDGPSPKANDEGKRQSQTTNEKSRREQQEREYNSAMRKRLVFLRLLSCMMAKVAKADGHVDETEIQAVEGVFVRLGFDDEQRQVCISAFRSALSSQDRMGVLASSFARAGFSLEIRILVYEILWDIACADGVLAVGEKSVLREAAAGLNLIQGTYERFYRERVKKDSTDYGQQEENAKRNRCNSELEEAYDELGYKSAATDDELRNAYRSLAKQLHPDILRAQGMPESLLARANERMVRINRAWELIKRSRNIR